MSTCSTSRARRAVHPHAARPPALRAAARARHPHARHDPPGGAGRRRQGSRGPGRETRASSTRRGGGRPPRGRLHLLSGLLRGAGAGEIDWRRVRDGEAAFRAYIRGRLDEVAPRIGVGRDALLATLDQIRPPPPTSASSSPDGPAATSGGSLPSRGSWPTSRAGWRGRDPGLAGRIVRAADRTLRLARTAHEEARGLLGDAVALVRAWRADGEVPRMVLARSDWLLDGWAQVCPSGRRPRGPTGRPSARPSSASPPCPVPGPAGAGPGSRRQRRGAPRRQAAGAAQRGLEDRAGAARADRPNEALRAAAA